MMAKATRKAPDLSGVTEVLDRGSYEWLGDEDPELLRAIELAVVGGAGAGAIRRHVVRETGRRAIAARCEQAARHVRRIAES